MANEQDLEERFSGQQSLERALELLREALSIIDNANSSADVAARMDRVIHDIARAINEEEGLRDGSGSD
jgi:hypothetical protein